MWWKNVDIKYFTMFFLLFLFTFSFANSRVLPPDFQKKLLVPEPLLTSIKYNDSNRQKEFNQLRLYFYQGDSLFNAGQLESSCSHYIMAANCAKGLNYPWAEIICYNRAGFVQYWLNQFQSSRSFYAKSIQIIKKSKSISDSLAFMESFLFFRIADNQISDRIILNVDSIYYNSNFSENSIKNIHRKIKYSFLKSRLALYQDDYNSLKSDLSKYKALLNTNAGSQGIWAFYYRLFQADYYNKLGDFPLALQYYSELENKVENTSNYFVYKYFIYSKICELYSSFFYFNKAAGYLSKIESNIKDKNIISYYYDYLLLGYVSERSGRSHDALAYYNKAKSLLDLNSVTDKRLILVFWYLAAYHNTVTSDKESQYYCISQAMKLLKGNPDRYLESFFVRMAGEMFLKHDGNQAIKFYNPLLSDLNLLMTDDSYFQQQYPFLMRSDYQAALKGRGKAYYNLSKSQNFDTTLLSRSYKDYQSALDLSLKLFHKVGYEDSKVSALNSIRSTYDDVFNVGYTFYEQTGRRAILFELLNYSENSKAYLLKNYLSDGIKRKISCISEKELIEADRLKMQVDTSLYLHSHNDKSDLKTESSNIDEVMTKTKAYEDYLQLLEKKYPKYARLKAERKVVQVPIIQKSLDSDQIVIEYFFNYNSFYIFYIASDTFGIHYQPIDHSFKEGLEKFRKNFGSVTYDIYTQECLDSFAFQSYAIYSLVLKPIEKLIKDKRLLIITDAELGYIPFETLITKDPATNPAGSFLEMQYLIKNYPVSYLYSVSQVIEEKKPPDRIVSYAGFAPRYGKHGKSNGDNFQYGDLPGAEEEILSAKEYYRGRLFRGKEVTKEKYFHAILHDDIVHLAMHTLIDEEEPRLSKLLFSPELNNDELQLHTHEVYSNEIHSSLVVLSACNTGTGKMNKGEGIFSIARSFLLAGIKNVIYTQWSVADKSSALLMKYFYQNLSEGMAVDVAMQQAKLRFLLKGDPAKTHPYYWAGYVNMGVPICLPANKHKVFLYLLITVLLVGTVIFILKRKTKL
jgi:CHAT domain-containing protein